MQMEEKEKIGRVWAREDNRIGPNCNACTLDETL
jgi:hypothetical protein